MGQQLSIIISNFRYGVPNEITLHGTQKTKIRNLLTEPNQTKPNQTKVTNFNLPKQSILC